MEFGILDILKLIGALGFFIYGMKVMSEGIQKAAGSRLRQILGAMTSNRVTGVFTGFFTTALIQSSSATTVMVVSFVNAGLLTLRQSIGVIMGANIGTTITGLLIAFFGFTKFKITVFALPILAIGFPMIFSNRDQLKSWGEFIIGFALLFMGLDELKHAVPDIKHNPEILSFLADFANMGLFSTISFILIGTLLTVIVQSSSAAMAVTLVLCQQGVIPFQMAAALVLGENIGTTITANLAAMIGNIHSKRAARAHFIFNVVGVIWMLIVFDYYLDGIAWGLDKFYGIHPYDNADDVKWGLTAFHSTFNILNTLLMVWFVASIEKLVIKISPSRGEVDEQYTLEYIGAGIMGTPELSLLEAQKEVSKFGKLTQRMLDFTKELINEQDRKAIQMLLKKIKKYEDITDKLETEVSEYLRKVSEGELSEEASISIRSMLSIVGDLERVGDIFYQMSKTIERQREGKHYFTPEQRNNILEMLSKVENSMKIMNENLDKEYDQVFLVPADEAETAINELRDELRRAHLKSIEVGDYNIQSGMHYSDLYSSSEKIGDHVINVTEAVVGKV